jgi:hypothetical protein
MELKDCFREGFSHWLLKSNKKNLHESEIDHKLVEDSLTEILNVILREPLADYFWYGYPEHGSKLSYTIPNPEPPEPQTVPRDSLRVDKEKIKIFLRDYKIKNILNQ